MENNLAITPGVFLNDEQQAKLVGKSEKQRATMVAKWRKEYEDEGGASAQPQADKKAKADADKKAQEEAEAKKKAEEEEARLETERLEAEEKAKLEAEKSETKE